MAFLLLGTAHLSWMDPQITNLVPVLKSYWLVIHVATITASYAFLGLGALLAAFNLILMIMVTRKSFQFIDLTIRELSNVIEMTLIVGLYMLTIGTFLGGVWANESWGRYWGWDPKETWALVTVLVYAFIAHMRMVPGLRGLFAFNLASLVGFQLGDHDLFRGEFLFIRTSFLCQGRPAAHSSVCILHCRCSICHCTYSLYQLSGR